jgi:hypothetical protein
MSTQAHAPQFRPLTRKDMEEYEKEMKATLAAKDAPKEEHTPEAEPEQPPAAPEDTTDWKKRFGDLTRHSQNQIGELKKQLEELNQKLNQQAQTRYATPEEVAKFEQEVSTAPVLKELIRLEAEKLINETKTELKTESETEKALARKQAEDVAKLSKSHPDWTDYDTGGSLNSIFTGWLDKQPPTIQRLADYTTTRDMDGTIAVLNMFKAEVKGKPSGSTKKPVGSNPASRSQPEIPAPKEGSFSVTEWNTKYEAASRANNKALENQLMADMKKAKAEGRLVL